MAHCEDVGLGSPPKPFYTNDNESINALLKDCLGYKKHQWGLFNAKVKEIVNQQQREVEKALIGYGEYRLRPQYSSLSVTEEKWFKLSQEQRQQCIAKFNKATVEQIANTKEVSSAVGNVATAVVMSAQSKELTCSSSISDSNRSFDQDITVGRFGSLRCLYH